MKTRSETVFSCGFGARVLGTDDLIREELRHVSSVHDRGPVVALDLLCEIVIDQSLQT
jgi:hypothetical protein